MSGDEPSDEMLMRLADGEIDEPLAAALRARIAADPALAARFAVFERTGRAAAGAFAPVAAQPVPDRLLAAVLAADAAARPDRQRAAEVIPMPRRSMRARLLPLALAASVAALLALPAGYMLGSGGAGGGLRDPLRGASALVAETLQSVASGGERHADGLTVRPLASHRVAGGICRDFLLDSPAGAVLGVACRDAAGWALRASVALGGGDALRTASADHPVIAAALEGLGAEPPLDLESEAAALRRGWR